MGVVARRELRPGMTLSEDILDRHGRLLMSSGVVLSDQHIRSLKLWGIATVTISDAEEGSDKPVSSGDSAVSSEVLDAAKAFVADLFYHNAAHKGHPIFRPLIMQAMLRATQDLASGRLMEEEAPFLLLTAQQNTSDAGDASSPSLDEMISNTQTVASLPAIYNEIIEVVNDPRSSSADVANVISGDTGLTARLLRVVNSAMYGFPGKIDTVTRAITVVGMNELCELALATSVIKAFGGTLGKVLNMSLFWKHSLCCGAIARILAGHMHLPSSERLFVNGLLHDVGRLVLFAQMPQRELRVIMTADESHRPVYSLERETFGYNHAEVGRALLSAWNLPEGHREVTAFHHSPNSSERFVVESSIVHVADILTCVMRIGRSAERRLPPFVPDAWNRLGLSHDILPGLFEEARVQMADLTGIFELDQ